MPALAVDNATAPLAGHAFSACDAARFAAPLLGPTADVKPEMAAWSADLSSALYNVDGWGAPYFFVNDDGDIAVRPHGAATLPGQEINLAKVVAKAAGSLAGGGLGLPLPLLVRFPDVLRHRVETLNAAFNYAVTSTGYGGRYQGVYPVKCNQDRYVVEDIVEFGAPSGFGLEAGSKPELLLTMSCLVARGSPDALLICNGYKDLEYISLALIARTMGLNTVIVLEQEEELDIVVEASRRLRLNVRPVLGMRARLRTKHAGHFGATSGEKGKFGLKAAEILSVVSKLKALGMLDCLQLLHFHIGSQIPTTALVVDGVGEAAQIYCELTRLGAAMRVIDVGGGLGVDYDGTHSAETDMSVAYSLEEYAAAVVGAVGRVCDRKGVQHPVICSESGRALVSHHSVLVFEAFSASVAPSAACNMDDSAALLDELTDDCRNLMAAALRGDSETCALYADQLKRCCAEKFKEGVVGLEHLAAVDGHCEMVARAMGAAEERPRTYNINLSVFTSIPDMWAIEQQFPIVPIQGLQERPAIDAILSDLTCDSDGKVDRFIGGRHSLPLHELPTGGRGYCLGMFLGGAYQEALGGVHNLLGGPSVVRVSQSDGPTGFAVTRAAQGPSCADVLRAVHHEPEVMLEVLKKRTEEGGATAAALARALGAMPYLCFDNKVEDDDAC